MLDLPPPQVPVEELQEENPAPGCVPAEILADPRLGVEQIRYRFPIRSVFAGRRFEMKFEARPDELLSKESGIILARHNPGP